MIIMNIKINYQTYYRQNKINWIYSENNDIIRNKLVIITTAHVEFNHHKH